MFKIMRRKDVLKEAGLSYSTLDRRIKSGLFVRPVSLGGRTVGWVSSEVNEVIAAWIAGKNEDEVKAIVITLEKARKTSEGK